MANTPYENFVLQTIIEDQYASGLEMMSFCNVVNDLTNISGMKIIRNKYTATDGTEILAKGAGNTKLIEASFEPEEVKIQLYQNHFMYYDEDLLEDPTVVETGVRHGATDMWNTTRGDIMAEFNKATLTVTASAYNFDAFVDAQVKLNLENVEGVEIFGLVNPELMGEVRKALKDSLQYVEAFARAGYVGTVAGVNLYTTKFVETTNGIVVATKDAVEYINKTGAIVEHATRSADEANKRENHVFNRKYGVPHFCDETKAVKIIKG